MKSQINSRVGGRNRIARASDLENKHWLRTRYQARLFSIIATVKSTIRQKTYLKGRGPFSSLEIK